MQVTFDTNVWRRLVFPERQLNNANCAALVKINSAIQNGLVHGFISESSATLEAIRLGSRAEFHASSIPRVKVTSNPQGNGRGMTIEIETAHSMHPGLSQPFEKALDEALKIGMKFLTSPYTGVPIPARLLNNPEIYAPDVFATEDYNELFGDVSAAIARRGVGGGALTAVSKEFTARLDGPRPQGWSDRELIHRVYEYVCASVCNEDKRRIEKAFSELADGDVVAAHVAFGNDYLCTEDRGRSAGAPSIFNAYNREWLRTAYGVKILNVQQLSDLL